MPQYGFSVGKIYATRNDTTGATPILIGEVQDISLDVSFNTKELFGQNQFPIKVARSQGKITGKAKFARIDGKLYNSIFFGLSTIAGGNLVVNDEAGDVPGETTYEIEVAQAATFAEDLGVAYETTGLRLTKVTDADDLALGTYMLELDEDDVPTGTYVFAAADADAAVLISYEYTPAVAVGATTLVTNQTSGVTPTFQLHLINYYEGNMFSVLLYKCVASKLSFAQKLEDFTMQDLDFACFANDAGNVMRIKVIEG